jgi:hypothetical protein
MRSFSSHDPATDSHGTALLQRRRLSSSTRDFVRHYAEMVAAMFFGMVVLGVPAGWALGAVGSSLSELKMDAPSLMLLGMAVTMTAPMSAWMRYRGHGWRANTEMAASMVLPTFAAIALLEAGMMTDIDFLLLVEHVAMLLGMLVAMLLRLDEYTQHHAHGHSQSQPQPAAA